MFNDFHIDSHENLIDLCMILPWVLIGCHGSLRGKVRCTNQKSELLLTLQESVRGAEFVLLLTPNSDSWKVHCL